MRKGKIIIITPQKGTERERLHFGEVLKLTAAVKHVVDTATSDSNIYRKKEVQSEGPGERTTGSHTIAGPQREKSYVEK